MWEILTLIFYSQYIDKNATIFGLELLHHKADAELIYRISLKRIKSDSDSME